MLCWGSCRLKQHYGDSTRYKSPGLDNKSELSGSTRTLRCIVGLERGRMARQRARSLGFSHIGQDRITAVLQRDKHKCRIVARGRAIWSVKFAAMEMTGEKGVVA